MEPHDAFQGHLAKVQLLLADPLQLVGQRRKDDIGQDRAVQRGEEGSSNGRPHIAGIAQVLQHGDQTHDGADDAQRGREGAQARKKANTLPMSGPLGGDFSLEDVPHQLWRGAIHYELKPQP